MLYRKIASLIEAHLQSDSNKILLIDGARQVGKTYIVRYVGQKLFDWNWILGNPYYYAKVYLNGNLYHEVSSDQPTYYDWVEGGGSVKVCGYYVYSTGLHSEEQCVTVR